MSNYGKDKTMVMIDSGSDITLISENTVKSAAYQLKIKQGFRINLLEVTGKSKVTGYVTLPLYFDTNEGPVCFVVEAYVVKGMATSLLIGNDYSDQYSLSIRRKEGETYLDFGESNRSVRIANSTSPGPIDDDGKPLKASIKASRSSLRTHREAQRVRRREKTRMNDDKVRTVEKVKIQPGSCKKVAVRINLKGKGSAYIEPILQMDGNGDEFYGAMKCIVESEECFVQVCNFTKKPIMIPKGKILGKALNPENYFDRPESLSKEENDNAV
ncbi:hypothetical protein SISNIDRAFT_491835 [Sistotremastrum niveocremeum HHB9708]|uniref:Peptidase A2 domain-containing protein n=1 Tax=Sistotremastrum niveocremeum HHB9708 TaxID=1314777 RepID=A0A164MBV3_9AGAM|nr:hypothetical protein SISNIDRAFT_491835 [Sistotremastrum niveocremeum HHB9708]